MTLGPLSGLKWRFEMSASELARRDSERMALAIQTDRIPDDGIGPSVEQRRCQAWVMDR